MVDGAVVTGLVLALVLGGLLGWGLTQDRRVLGRIAHQTVIVHVEDQSYRGVLVGQYRDALVLAHASLLGAESDVTLPGYVYVPREKVALIQAP